MSEHAEGEHRTHPNKRRAVKRLCKISKALLRTEVVLLIAFALANQAGAQTALIRFDFTGRVFSTFGVPNAGTSVSGHIIFDSSAPLTTNCRPHCARYSQSAPATFVFTTNGGFRLRQKLTSINISDKLANGTTDYYVFDADVGSTSSHWSRLELSLSNNSNPFIPNISIPTTPPDFSAFQFHTVSFFAFDGNMPTQRVHAVITSLTKPKRGRVPSR
jgi:hypothetical protein